MDKNSNNLIILLTIYQIFSIDINLLMNDKILLKQPKKFSKTQSFYVLSIKSIVKKEVFWQNIIIRNKYYDNKTKLFRKN